MSRPLRCAVIVPAPQVAVHRALRRADVWIRGLRAVGLRVQGEADAGISDGAAVRALRTGDRWLLRPDARRGPRTAEFGVAAWTPEGQPGGPGRPAPSPLPVVDVRFGVVRARVTPRTAATGAGTLTTLDVRVAGSDLLAPVGRRRVLAFGQLLLGVVTVTAREPEVVVAGAVVRDDRVLVARRRRPPALAGLWEMPGGRVEPGEDEADALARELREELGVTVAVRERLDPPSIDLGDGLRLRPFLVDLVAGTPAPAEADPAHDEVRWAGAAELAGLPFLPGDAPMVDAVRRLLERRGQG
ncbi:(deoxy)nucleoside triphosphate pyrophosphohydrolase [Nakamurella endophytica]|uniref:(deoxy)nucleoside triphosphate pyrophosphohydrolase n=1 Tax=Nakamurella endophytica TaxID=1748367 RepID=UPI0027E4E964|nr:(deoxy)nucleoside triphosphate pyrophosphohydrolase [Nakamurella endophytica]